MTSTKTLKKRVRVRLDAETLSGKLDVNFREEFKKYKEPEGETTDDEEPAPKKRKVADFTSYNTYIRRIWDDIEHEGLTLSPEVVTALSDIVIDLTTTATEVAVFFQGEGKQLERKHVELAVKACCSDLSDELHDKALLHCK